MPAAEIHPLKNIGFGGLCYQTDKPIETGTEVSIRLPPPACDLEVRGRVSWYRQAQKGLEVGIQFLPENAEDRVLLVEQVCELEHRRKEHAS